MRSRQIIRAFVISPKQLARILFIMLQDRGAHNINLVNPTHFAVQIKRSLLIFARTSSGFQLFITAEDGEKTDVIDAASEFTDIFLPDLKYFDSDISFRYSKARGIIFDFALRQ